MDMETIVQKQQQTKDCQQILPRCTKHDEFCSHPVPRSQGRIHAERLKTISLHHSYHCFGRKNLNFFFMYTLACNLKGLFTFEIWNVHGKQSMEKKKSILKRHSYRNGRLTLYCGSTLTEWIPFMLFTNTWNMSSRFEKNTSAPECQTKTKQSMRHTKINLIPTQTRYAWNVLQLSL